KSQKQIFDQAFGYSRYIYNKALDTWIKMYEDHKLDNSKEKPTHRRVRNILKKNKEEWEDNQLKQVLETSVEDVGKAYNMMWKGVGKYPKFKSKKKSKLSCRFFRKNDYSLQVRGERKNKLKLVGIDSEIHMKESLTQ